MECWLSAIIFVDVELVGEWVDCVDEGVDCVGEGVDCVGFELDDVFIVSGSTYTVVVVWIVGWGPCGNISAVEYRVVIVEFMIIWFKSIS